MTKGKKLELSKEEQSMIAALRRLRAAEARPPRTPEALLEHGYVGKRRAAQLLGLKEKDIERRCDHNRWSRGEVLPTVGAELAEGGKIPISELRREFGRMHRERLRELAREVVTCVKVETADVAGWHHYDGRFPFGNGDQFGGPRHALGMREVAEKLGMSLSALNRMKNATKNDTAGLFFWGRDCGDWVVTQEETTAYQRAMKRNSGSKRAA